MTSDYYELEEEHDYTVEKLRIAEQKCEMMSLICLKRAKKDGQKVQDDFSERKPIPFWSRISYTPFVERRRSLSKTKKEPIVRRAAPRKQAVVPRVEESKALVRV